MDIRQLQYFLTTCEHGSFLKAAEYAYVSQQALSKAIASLEKEIGLSLFTRTSQGLLLTEAGELVREYARPVAESMTILQDQITAYKSFRGSQISFAHVAGIDNYLDKKAMARLAAAFPGMHFFAEERTYNVCESLVARGIIPFAIVNGPSVSSEFKTIEILKTRRVLVCPKDHPLAQRSEVSVADLGSYEMIVNINERCFTVFNDLCRKYGVRPSITRVNDGIAMLRRCDTDGMLGLQMEFILEHMPPYPNLVAVPFGMDEFAFPIVMIINPTWYRKKNIPEICAMISRIIHERETPLTYPYHL